MSTRKLLALKFTEPNGDTYFCSHPMIHTIDKKSNTFRAQLIRNVDLTIIARKNENIKVQLLLFPLNSVYNDIFTMNKYNTLVYDNFLVKSIGTYIIPVNITEEETVFNLKKGYVKHILNLDPILNISLRTIYDSERNSYQLTLPAIEGDLSYLEQ
jgi:hypothetical protein